ncbi:MAG TPA: Uma2 family endonuclease [Gemmatimonadaceae bacterium]|nr:Uma2 family endonuclease [Gemmatimonadaceae bacterium]
MPQTLEKRWTAAEVRALQEQDPSHRYQAVDGELLVSPGPARPHQRCVKLLILALDPFVERSRCGEVFMGPGEVVPDDFTTMQPDVFVVPLVEAERTGEPTEFRHLSLACEVLSPSTARFDRVKKRPKYQSMGATYWIFDMDARVVECWLPQAMQPTIHDVEVRWQPDGASEPFVLDLVAFFQKVHREG